MIGLVAAFQAVIGGLERLSIRYAVVGSTAAASHGVVRVTRDVDLVTTMSLPEADRLFEGFGADLYVPIEFAREGVTVEANVVCAMGAGQPAIKEQTVAREGEPSLSYVLRSFWIT